MDTRIEKIINAFTDNGWELIGSIDTKSDWWFEDILKLTPVWNAVEKNIYLILLTDPQEEKMKKVWNVSVTITVPEERNHNAIHQIALNDVKRIDLNATVKAINNIVWKM